MTPLERDLRQVVIDLPVRVALGREDFYVTEANALAVAQIDGWRHWPGSKFALTGPRGSGKTHLANVWQADSGARIIAAADLPSADVPALAAGPVCVEDIGGIAGDRTAEAALFHLHNLVLSEGHALLMTAPAPPAQLGLALPDLASRLMGTQFARLALPDDALLGAILLKLFADRQIRPGPTVVPYLVPRMRRSFSFAQRLVDEIDRTALATHREVTRALAQACLSRLEQEVPTDV
ncbi:DnaA regulatory inactivator Hda [Roseivivax jejudonensis]|uniref:DnaA regulatory inactivator Hda n=1 Tax=Roseivivax jejudonensis TaxID=1529041 RepID=A0A1X6YU93_9RHOB|nr:chromosomal replication initiator DnaA [Roseivivax jejudonensis]SLN30982.1 DnaA regulatory inactivator Hda [Roseivivax jejudonensis]